MKTLAGIESAASFRLDGNQFKAGPLSASHAYARRASGCYGPGNASIFDRHSQIASGNQGLVDLDALSVQYRIRAWPGGRTSNQVVDLLRGFTPIDFAVVSIHGFGIGRQRMILGDGDNLPG